MKKYIYIVFILISIVSCNTESKRERYELLYLDSNYDEVVNSVEMEEFPSLLYFSLLKSYERDQDYSGMNSFAFFLNFKNFNCRNNDYFLDDYLMDIEYYDFNQYNSQTLTQIALDYEIMLDCDLRLKDIFLREALKQDHNNLFALKELINLAILSANYSDALSLVEYLSDKNKNSIYYSEVKEYCIERNGLGSVDTVDIEDILKEIVFDEKKDLGGYSKFW